MNAGLMLAIDAVGGSAISRGSFILNLNGFELDFTCGIWGLYLHVVINGQRTLYYPHPRATLEPGILSVSELFMTG